MSSPAVRLALRAAGFAIAMAAWLLLVAGQFARPTLASRWMTANFDGAELALRGISEPRMLLVGGSSVIFGLRADQFTEALGIPTVNFGNHAALGVDYLFHRADRWLRSGDTVVLALEYDMYVGAIDNQGLVDYLLAGDPGYILSKPWPVAARILTMPSFARILEGYGIGVVPQGHSDLSLYSAPAGDGFGDNIGNLPPLKLPKMRGPSYLGAANAPVDTDIKDANLAVIRSAIERWKARGVRIVSVAPPILDRPAYHAPAMVTMLERLRRFYAENAVPMPVDFERTMYPARDFFDTRYHLDSVAARDHTAMIVDAIRPLVPRPATPTRWRPPPPAHPLADVARRFAGWQPTASVLEDWRYPPYFRGAAGPVSIEARTAAPGDARLRVIVAAKPIEDMVRIAVGGKPKWRCALKAGSSNALDVPLGTLANGTVVTLDQGEAAVFDELHIDWHEPPHAATPNCEAAPAFATDREGGDAAPT